MSGTSPGWLNCALFGMLGNGLFFSVVCAERALGVVLGLTIQSRWVYYLGEGLPAMFLPTSPSGVMVAPSACRVLNALVHAWQASLAVSGLF